MPVKTNKELDALAQKIHELDLIDELMEESDYSIVERAEWDDFDNGVVIAEKAKRQNKQVYKIQLESNELMSYFVATLSEAKARLQTIIDKANA